MLAVAWCGAKAWKHPTLPSVTWPPPPGNWGAWGLGPWGGSHQLRLSLEAVRTGLVVGGSRAKSGPLKTWWEAEVRRKATPSHFPFPTSALSQAPLSN